MSAAFEGLVAAVRRSRSAAVVNTGSIAATAGLPERALYSASKGAVLDGGMQDLRLRPRT